MSEEKVLKGVYREGSTVASVILKEETARIMLKGVDPASPRDPAFTESLKKVLETCKPHIGTFEKRELTAVLVERPALAEYLPLGPEELQALGITKFTILDGSCGIAIRVVENDPPPTPLAYASLAASAELSFQPGMATIPLPMARKCYKDLTPPQQKVFEVTAQVAGRSVMRLVCIDDQGIKLVATLIDLPPPRGRSVIVPLGKFADELAGGASLESIAQKLAPLRG